MNSSTVLALAGISAFTLTSVEPESGAASTVVVRDDVTDTASLALAERFTATVRCEPDGSGTLIADRWVLTAAHVGRGLSPFTPTVHVAGKAHRVRQVLFHPESESDGRRPPRVDLALVELAEAVEQEGVVPVPIYTRDDEVGQLVHVVGYGDFGPAGGKLARNDGRRRAATNIVDKVERGRLLIDMDRPDEGTELEGVGGPGDSGGPLFLEEDGKVFLAGVSTASMGGRPGSYGMTDLYVRVSEHSKWIEATRKSAPELPVARVQIVEVGDGFPEGQRGALLAAFFEAYAAGTEESLRAFEDEHRSADAARRNPSGALTRRLLGVREEFGSFEPKRVAEVSDGKWVVLVKSEKRAWHAVHLRFAGDGEEVRLDDLGIRPEVAPE